MIKQSAKISPEERKIIKTVLIAEGIYEAVLEELGFGKARGGWVARGAAVRDDESAVRGEGAARGDDVYRELILGMLKRQTKDHIVFSIWNNLNPKQIEHLREYMSRAFVIAPFLSHEDILMEFAMLYPDLMKKVYSGLSGFFKSFIAKFREIDSAEA